MPLHRGDYRPIAISKRFLKKIENKNLLQFKRALMPKGAANHPLNLQSQSKKRGAITAMKSHKHYENL